MTGELVHQSKPKEVLLDLPKQSITTPVVSAKHAEASAALAKSEPMSTSTDMQFASKFFKLANLPTMGSSMDGGKP